MSLGENFQELIVVQCLGAETTRKQQCFTSLGVTCHRDRHGRHAFHCQVRGVIVSRHNHLRDFLAQEVEDTTPWQALRAALQQKNALLQEEAVEWQAAEERALQAHNSEQVAAPSFS